MTLGDWGIRLGWGRVLAAVGLGAASLRLAWVSYGPLDALGAFFILAAVAIAVLTDGIRR